MCRGPCRTKWYNNYVLFFLEFQSVGCWSDSIDQHSLLALEGKHPLLMDGNGASRANALMKCAEAAWDIGLKVFALQNGGDCMGEDDGERKFMKQGMSTLCHGKNVVLT